jgi:lysophospholipase L1-like esterase
MGASYAADWGEPDLAAFPLVINNGVGGEETSDVRERFQQDVIEPAPRAVLLWGFLNDIYRAPEGGMTDTKIRIRENIRYMVDTAREHGIEPILATEVTIRHEAGLMSSIKHLIGRLLGKTSYQDTINAHVMETNEWVRSFAAEEDIRLLDFEGVLANDNNLRRARYAIDDGSHLSEAAYEALTEYTNNRFRAWYGD